VTHTTFWTRHC